MQQQHAPLVVAILLSLLTSFMTCWRAIHKVPGRLGNVVLLLALFSTVSALPLDAPAANAASNHPHVPASAEHHEPSAARPRPKMKIAPDTVHTERTRRDVSAKAKLLHGNQTLAMNHSPDVLMVVKHSVRWFNRQDMRFGSSVNITFLEPMDFARHWQIRFRFKSDKVEIDKYWGSWALTRLSFAHWYQAKPTPDLRMDLDATVYLNFNAAADASTHTDLLELAECELQLDQGPNKQPLVSRLWESSTGGGGLVNAPFKKELPAEPFGRFAPNNPALKPPVRLAEALQGPVGKIIVAPKGTFSFVGVFVVGSALFLLCNLLVCSACRSWWWRRNFRRLKRREELKWQTAKRPPASRRGLNQEKTPDANEFADRDWRERDDGYTVGTVALYSGPELLGTKETPPVKEPKAPLAIKTRASVLREKGTPPPWSPSSDSSITPDSPNAPWLGTVSNPRTGRKMSAYYHNTLGKPASPPPYSVSPVLRPQAPSKAFSPRTNSPLSSSVVRRPSPPAVSGLGVANVIGTFADAAGLVIREEEEEGVEQVGDIGGGGERWEYGGDMRTYASKKRQLRKLEMIQEAQAGNDSTDDPEDDDGKRDSLDMVRERNDHGGSVDSFDAEGISTDRLSRMVQEDASRHQPLPDTDSESEMPRRRRGSSSASRLAAEEEEAELSKPLPPSRTLCAPAKSCLKSTPSTNKKSVQWDEASFAARIKQKRVKRVTKEEKAARQERKRREAQEKAQQEGSQGKEQP